MPVDINGNAVNPHDPSQWMSRLEADNYAELLGLGVGFVFTNNDPYWFLDLDHCIVDGGYTPIAEQLLEAFTGAYVEVSTSGEGLHLFGQGTVPPHSCKNKTYGIELYTEGRFVLLTGTNATGTWDLDWSQHMQWLVDNYFPPAEVVEGQEWNNNEPEISDDVLIGKMCNRKATAAQVFGGKASISDLFGGDVEVLARAYPSINMDDPFDRSSADAALAAHLAFWTNKNHGQIARIMQRSSLVREKWEKHRSYLTMTITNAVNNCSNTYSPVVEVSPVIGEEEVSTAGPTLTSGAQFLSAHQQIEYFKGCVYIKRSHGLLTPNGAILKPEVFKASYGGYTFALDNTNDKTTRNPYEAFMDNQSVRFDKVDSVCFRIDVPSLEIIEEEGLTLVNTYVPIKTKRTKGDVSLFLNHMVKLFPNETDHAVIMAYMAACVQHAGYKFQWAPLIQGGEGNGKTLINRVIEKAIGRRYTHYPNASDLAGGGLKFNGWIMDKLFIALEECYVADRKEITEPLKVLITNDRVEIQFKGQNQFTGDNLANWIIMTNHKDAMKLSYDQRRYWFCYTPQQTEADLTRDGMDSNYFKKLYDWLKLQDGYAMVSEYLYTYDIPVELNPAMNLQRAPKSSYINEVVSEGLGMIEQTIVEAIEEDRQGFRGGYISSKALNDLLIGMKLDHKISPMRRTRIMESMGYKKHPWLRSGRVDNPVLTEGKKITIYINKEPTGPRISAAAVKDDYEKAQGYFNTGLQAVK